MAATFILLMLKLFEKGYEFDEVGHFIEIFTYFLFCYTFAVMFSRVTDSQSTGSVQRKWNIAIAILLVLLVAASLLVFLGFISRRCNKKTEQWPAVATLIFEFISFIPTAYYGFKIMHHLIKSQKRNT